MPYHSDFWIAVAAASPVIAVSSTVVLSDNARMAVAAISVSRSSSFWRQVKKKGMKAVYFSLGNVGMQSVILWFALQALMDGKNALPPQVAATAEFLGLVSVFSATTANSAAQMMIASYRLTKTGKDSHMEDTAEDDD